MNKRCLPSGMPLYVKIRRKRENNTDEEIAKETMTIDVGG